jgi:hypothetical protein
MLLAGWSINLVENKEIRLLYEFKELDSLSVPDLGGSLQAAEYLLG